MNNKKYLKIWIVMLVLTFVFQLVPHAKAAGPCGAWENAAAERRSNMVLAGIAGGAGIVGLFFPPALFAAAIFGGIAAMNEGAMAFSQC